MLHTCLSFVGTSILRVESTDIDLSENAAVQYFISSGDLLGNFIMRDSGEIYLNKRVDRERQAQYQLVVTATDGVHVSTAQVIIDILDANDNDPICDEVSLASFFRMQLFTCEGEFFDIVLIYETVNELLIMQKNNPSVSIYFKIIIC